MMRMNTVGNVHPSWLPSAPSAHATLVTACDAHGHALTTGLDSASACRSCNRCRARRRRGRRRAGPTSLSQVARAADRLGFAWITCSDHVAVPAVVRARAWARPGTSRPRRWRSSPPPRTRVRLLSHVLVLPYRHPLLAAKLFATLDRALRRPRDHRRRQRPSEAGVPQPRPRPRGARGDERRIPAARWPTALEQEVSSFTGRFVRWRDMMVAPRPVQTPRPPIWVGGNTPAMARRAGRRGDGWIPWQIAREEFVERAAVARDAHARQRPRRPFAARRARRWRADASDDLAPRCGARSMLWRRRRRAGVPRRLHAPQRRTISSSCSNGSRRVAIAGMRASVAVAIARRRRDERSIPEHGSREPLCRALVRRRDPTLRPRAACSHSRPQCVRAQHFLPSPRWRSPSSARGVRR